MQRTPVGAGHFIHSLTVKMLTLRERVFLIEHVFRNQDKYTDEVKQQFRSRFHNTVLPHRNTVRDLINKFRETGSVQDAPRSGRPTLLTDETLRTIAEKMDNSPRKSIRQLSRESDIGVATAYKAVRTELCLYPYKIRAVQELKDTDHAKRLHYCRWFLEAHLDLDYTFYSDEAWFHLSGYVNSQNSRTWSALNPFELHESPLHSLKVGVWIAISRRRIIGPFFFGETVTSQRYINILSKFIGELSDNEKSRAVFQQDSATAHTSNETLTWLRHNFGDRLITKDLWPPRSPDLTPPDFYFWGAAKANVYKNKPRTLQELQDEILRFTNSVTPDQLARVFDNMRRRVNECIRVGGAHFQHLL